MRYKRIATVVHLPLILNLSSSHLFSASPPPTPPMTLLANVVHMCMRRALSTMTTIARKDDCEATLGKVMAKSSAVGS
ncbi:hypothetical protein DAI22_12g057800 [Oryza sativa Japonica Group]|nr:hypothetical protein DAI22_12g057800 [Oryza sativa Japonica Group]